MSVACSILGIKKCTDVPPNIPNVKNISPQEKIRELAGHVVDQCGLIEEALLLMPVDNTNDGVYNYARILCHYGSLVLEFMDEGDGDRVGNFCLFTVNGHCKLISTTSTQLKWGRFINYKGGAGRNIPCDLHNEHINRTI